MINTQQIDASKVIFFLGNSGSGKDTLIRELAEKIESLGFTVKIPKRRITRVNHKSEKFISLGKKEFKYYLDGKEFVLNWNIYGNDYGYMKTETLPFLDGRTFILMNISRTVALEASKIFPNSKFIKLLTDKQIAIDRIKNRKRETKDMIDERIKRMGNNIPLPEIAMTLENNYHNDLRDNVEKIINFLKI